MEFQDEYKQTTKCQSSAQTFEIRICQKIKKKAGLNIIYRMNKQRGPTV